MIHGPFFACCSVAINVSNAPITEAEAGSSGAFAAKGSFQKLDGEKKRNGAAGATGATREMGSAGAAELPDEVARVWCVAGAGPAGELSVKPLRLELLCAPDAPPFRMASFLAHRPVTAPCLPACLALWP